MTRAILLTLFFLSGACGLVYEVVWQRMLEQIFGVTSYVTAAILAAFMGGLALGSLVFGRTADWFQRPMVVYGLLEIGIGVYAALLPSLMSLVTPALVAMQLHGVTSPVLVNAAKFAVPFLIFLPPTFLMGASLPAISRAAIVHERKRGGEFGALYGINTLGAVVGCVVAGFVSIRFLGVRESVYAAAVVNVAIGVLAVAVLGRQARRDSSEVPVPGSATQSLDDSLSPGLFRLVLTIFGLTGFCALAYEVLWSRALVFFFTSNTYAFTTMLASFLVSSAVGTLIAGLFVDRLSTRGRLALLGILQGLIGCAVLVTLWEFPHLDDWVTSVTVLMGASVRSFFIARFLCSLLVMMPAALLMGMSFTLTFRILAGPQSSIGRSAGTIYSVNTLGCIAGSLAAGFFLIPAVGVTSGIAMIAAVNAGAAVVLVITGFKGRLRMAIPAVAGVILATLILVVLAPRTPFVASVRTFNNLPGTRLVYYGEDHTGSSWVQTLPGGHKRLGVNANLMADNGVLGVLEHKLASHLPLLLHPDPKTAIAVGLGMGMTSYAALQHGVKLDVAELCPSEIKAQMFFQDLNHNVLQNPNCTLRLTDGRNYLMLKRNYYDVIQMGITHPLASSGNAAFYTEDCYTICRRALKEGGIVSQWVPIHDITTMDFKILVRTFLKVFPHAILFLNYFPDNCYLVGSAQPLSLDWELLSRKFANPAIQADLATMGITSPYALYGLCALDEEMLKRITGPGPIFTDNHPNVEFDGAARKKNMFGEILGEVLDLRAHGLNLLTDTANARIPFVAERADSFLTATQHVMEALRAHERSDLAVELDAYAQAQALNPGDSAAAYLYRVAQRTKCILEGSAASQRGDFQTTLALYEKAVALDPTDPGQVQLIATIGWVYCAIDVNTAETWLRLAIGMAPEYAPARMSMAEVYARQGRRAECIGELKTVLRLDRKNAQAARMLKEIQR